MASTADVQAATLDEFIASWKAWEPNAFLDTFDQDFSLVTLPSSIGMPPQPRAVIEKLLPIQMDLVKNYQLQVRQVIHDAANNKAAVYAESTGETELGPWATDYAVFITFNEAGSKVKLLEEMLDSAFMKDFRPKFGKYAQEQMAKGGF